MTTATDRRLGRSFWLLWWAATGSALGDGVRYVAFPLLAADLTTDPRGVSLVFAAGYLPWLLVGLLSGAVVDRVDRRRLMWRIDLGRAAVLAAFAALVAAQRPAIAALAAVSFGLGVAGTFFDNAASAITPMIAAPGPALDRANAWLMSSQTLNSALVGTFAGAALFGWRRDVPFVLDAVTFFAAALLVLRIGGDFAVSADVPRTTVRRDIGEGLRWLRRHRLLRTCCLLVLAVNGTLAAAEAVLVLYARQLLHLGDVGYSLLLGVLAAGGVIGGSAAPALRARLPLPALLTGCVLLQAAALVATGLLVTVAAAVAGLAAVGLATSVWNVVTVSLRQAVVPARLLGRVTGSYRLVGLAAMPAGAAGSGILAHACGLRTVPIAAGGLLAVAALLAWRGVRAPAGGALGEA